MPAGIFSRSAAAFENYFRIKRGGGNHFCFKKFYGQKRDLFYGLNPVNVNMQRIHISTIDFISFILKPKYFQCHPAETGRAYLENFMFLFRYFRKIIQFLIFKFEF